MMDECYNNMEYFYQQVLQKDVTRRLQVGQELIDYLNDPQRSSDVEQDRPQLDATIDELAGWVNSSNFKTPNQLQHRRLTRDPARTSKCLPFTYWLRQLTLSRSLTYLYYYPQIEFIQ
ncbi:UNVERIFIED_CONTAM: hypothetical protein FKN15_006798 [Acipenser sinensis]